MKRCLCFIYLGKGQKGNARCSMYILCISCYFEFHRVNCTLRCNLSFIMTAIISQQEDRIAALYFPDNFEKQTCGTVATSLLFFCFFFLSGAADLTSHREQALSCLPKRLSWSECLAVWDDWRVIDRWPDPCLPPRETSKPNNYWIHQGDPHVNTNQLFTYLRLRKKRLDCISRVLDRHAFCRRRGMERSPAITPRLIPQLWWA